MTLFIDIINLSP